MIKLDLLKIAGAAVAVTAVAAAVVYALQPPAIRAKVGAPAVAAVTAWPTSVASATASAAAVTPAPAPSPSSKAAKPTSAVTAPTPTIPRIPSPEVPVPDRIPQFSVTGKSLECLSSAIPNRLRLTATVTSDIPVKVALLTDLGNAESTESRLETTLSVEGTSYVSPSWSVRVTASNGWHTTWSQPQLRPPCGPPPL